MERTFPAETPVVYKKTQRGTRGSVVRKATCLQLPEYLMQFATEEAARRGQTKSGYIGSLIRQDMDRLTQDMAASKVASVSVSLPQAQA